MYSRMAVKSGGGSVHMDPTARKCGSGTQDPTIMIAATGKKRGAEVAEIEKLKASRGDGESVSPAGVWRSGAL